MKKLLIASVAAVALTTGQALAADLAYKAPPPPPPVIGWTGCYVDGGIGYGFFKQDHYEETDPLFIQLTPTVSTGGEGWLGRVGAGCDYQASRFVIGAFADYDFTDFKGTFQDSFFGFTGQEKETGSWAAGGRLGYLVTPGLLGYVDAGYTQARFDSIGLATDTIPSVAIPGLGYPSQTYNGWFIGGGTEYALSGIVPFSGLFWRTEYRYNSYDAEDVPLLLFGAPTGLASHMQKDVQTVTSGLVWRFNWGGPIATRD